MQSQTLDIRLMGPPEITLDGVPVEVDTRKAIALLAYLTVEQSATRDALAALFWRDSDEGRARAAFRRTLSSLRKAIGPDWLEADRLMVTLLKGAQVDVFRFRQCLDATEDHGHDPSDVCIDCIPYLKQAADLYRGDFLAGFSVRDAPEFEDWVRNTGEHLRFRASDALNKLATARAGNGDYPGAIEAVSRWIELDPLHEPAHRRLMLLHAWSGDRPGAVAAYRRCVAVLDDELGVSPLEETSEFYEAILDEDLPPAPRQRRSVIVAASPTRPMAPDDLVGRTEELNVLRQELAGVTRDEGRVVVITGEPWMGKTRLVQEFLKETAGGGTEVIRARGFRAETSLPFGVVVQLLRGIRDWGDMPAWATREVARLVPDLLPDQDVSDSSLDTYGETLLFDALVSVLTLRSGVIWVDDAQWCDRASASLIGYLANRIKQTPVLLVLSMRTGPLESPPPLADLARPDAPDKLIELRPLSVDDLPVHLSEPARASSILSETGGIPLLVSAHLSDDPIGLGAGVQRFVDSHLTDLSELERQILTTTAVLDGLCDLDLLRTTSGRSDEETVEAVERLVMRDLLRLAEDGQGVGFAVESVRHLLYERASLVRRRLLHGRAAHLLEERTRVDPDSRTVAAVARHLHLSGSDDEAAAWYLRAADLALEVYAHLEAESSYQMALALGHPESVRVQLSLARLLLSTGRYREALAEYEKVAASADSEDAALAEHGIGEVHRRLGHLELAARHFAQAESQHPQQGLLYADWALLAHRQEEAGEAIRLAQRSLEEAEASANTAMTARALHLLGVVTPDPDDASFRFRQALDLAIDHPDQRMASLNGLAWTMERSGDFAGAGPLVEEALELARTIGDRHRQAALLNHLADIQHRTGNDAEAERLVTESVRLFAEIEPDAWEPEIWLLTHW